MNICIDNLNINYETLGSEGKAVVLLHGWGSNITLFENMMKNLSSFCKVYALDMPGFGQSEYPPQAWNVDDYVEFVIKFIEKMQIKNCTLLGHSFGGRLIIKMVNKEKLPFEVDKVVLVDSAGIKPEIKNTFSIRKMVYKLSKSVFSISFVKKCFPNALDKLKSKFGSEDYRNAKPVMRDTLVRVVNEDLEPLLRNIKQSTLLIWGDLDTATPLSDAKKMEELIPDAGLVLIEGAGHYSFLEQPILVNNVLNSFLGGKK